MSGKLDLDQHLESLRVPSTAERIVTPGLIPVAFPTPAEIAKQFEGQTKTVEAVPGEIRDSMGALVTQTVTWLCDSSLRNHLIYNGAPFRVQELYYHVDNISWQAGDGWPVYSTYCPRNDYHSSMRYPNAFVHQIVPEFGGSYWFGCFNPGHARGNAVTEVFFSVNDSNYTDNRGTFVVVVTGWA